MMNKLLWCIAIVIVCASMAFGEGSPPHVMIRNALKCTGGSDGVFVQEHDYSDWEYDPPDDEDQYAGFTVLAQEWANLPAPRNTVPTQRHGLVNPYEPVEITAYGDTLEISDWGGDDIYAFRLFDKDGKFITGNSVLNGRHTPQTIKLTPEPENYYLEFAQRKVIEDDAEGLIADPEDSPEYCYVLLRMSAGRARNLKDEPVRVPPEHAEEYEASQVYVQDYMRRHGIKNIGDLTADDFVNMAVEKAREASHPQ